MIRLIAIASLIAFTLGGAFAQTTERPAFEVASVKPNKAGEGAPWRMSTSRGDITATNVTLQFLIKYAYNVRDHQISGGPSWVNSEKYDLVAKQSSDDRSPAKTKLMLQTLLADRFHLRLRPEIKELPVYALVVGKNGHKLHEAHEQGTMSFGRGRLTARRASMERLAENLGNQLGRTVVDRTGLQGSFAFELEWTPDPDQPLRLPLPSPAPADPSGPSIFTAVQEQLGLKLEPQKGSVEILVIDHVERPSEN